MGTGIQATVGGVFPAEVIILRALHRNTFGRVFPSQHKSRRTDHFTTDRGIFLTGQIPGIAVGFLRWRFIRRLRAGGEEEDGGYTQETCGKEA
ncbi:MAG: hypothetical protein D6732_13005 [Methanobacteriota archaeon]|nr:MAG: hypothetical protein D6732_13005 [Euryarchaeota archaeon]